MNGHAFILFYSGYPGEKAIAELLRGAGGIQVGMGADQRGKEKGKRRRLR